MYDDAHKHLRSGKGIDNLRKETYVAFVLDESGSMGICTEEAITGFNEQLNVIREQAHHGGKNYVSLYKFGSRPDSRPRRVFANKRPNELKNLTRTNYSPFGNTPLRDGVGMALSDLEQYDHNDDVNRAFLVIVFTDGFENASKEWSVSQLNERIEALNERGNWTITFVGSKVDPTQMAETSFVYMNNMGSYASTPDAWDATSWGLDRYYTTDRAAGQTSTASFLVDTSSTDQPE